MSTRETGRRALPDVAADAQADHAGTLAWVGMDDIEMPLLVAAAEGAPQRVSARVGAFVSLDRADARGIHMSRLYLHLDRHLSAEILAPAVLRRVLRDFLDSHAGLSLAARVSLRFDHLLRRPALASGHGGWRAYPVEVSASLRGTEFVVELGVEVQYSSTCPASAALARQLIQARFAEDFADRTLVERERAIAWLGSSGGIVATPHSQRSVASIRARLAAGFDFPFTDVIDLVEGALATPVQAAVKREDEQAFALANGQNLMFCEDAARRIRAALDADERIVDFRVQATHGESLHPHDAVAVATKGVAGGY
jgi:GTP cyclohydrolase I